MANTNENWGSSAYTMTVDRTMRPTWRTKGVRVWRLSEQSAIWVSCKRGFKPLWWVDLFAKHGDRTSECTIVLTREQARRALADLARGFKR